MGDRVAAGGAPRPPEVEQDQVGVEVLEADRTAAEVAQAPAAKAAWCSIEQAPAGKAAWCSIDRAPVAKAAWCSIDKPEAVKAAWCSVDAAVKAAWCSLDVPPSQALNEDGSRTDLH